MSSSDAAELRQAGLLASDEAVARVIERFGVPGSGDTAHVLEVTLDGGLRFEVLLDRGFDIGVAEFEGQILSWRSPVLDGRPLSVPQGSDWLDRFTGGLLTTCGPNHVGAATVSDPLHGQFSHRPASAVRVSPARGRAEARLRADVAFESIFGPSLRVEREIRAHHRNGTSTLSIRDRVRNTGSQVVPVAMLYHLNFGAPLFVPGSDIQSSPRLTSLRNGTSVTNWQTAPEPTDDITEWVFLHEYAPNSSRWETAHVTSPARLRVSLRWTTATLPYLHQWVLPTRGRWALGIEPSTVAMFEGSDPSIMVAPTLRPSETRDQCIELIISRTRS